MGHVKGVENYGMRDCRTAEWTFIMSLFLSMQECWAWSQYNLTCSLSPVGSHFFDDLLRINYVEKYNYADGLNICLSSHHKHNHYTIKSHFAQLELSKLFPVALVRDKKMFRVHNHKYIQLELLCFYMYCCGRKFSFVVSVIFLVCSQFPCDCTVQDVTFPSYWEVA